MVFPQFSFYSGLCFPCFISCHPFDCPVHPDALHPPSADVVSSSCATPALVAAPTTLCYSGEPLCRQMAGCRPARRERANLPAGIAGGGCWGRDRWLVSAEARLLWSRQPRPGKRPVSPRRRPALHERSQNNQSHALQDKRRRWQVHAVCR